MFALLILSESRALDVLFLLFKVFTCILCKQHVCNLSPKRGLTTVFHASLCAHTHIGRDMFAMHTALRTM